MVRRLIRRRNRKPHVVRIELLGCLRLGIAHVGVCVPFFRRRCGAEDQSWYICCPFFTQQLRQKAPQQARIVESDTINGKSRLALPSTKLVANGSWRNFLITRDLKITSDIHTTPPSTEEHTLSSNYRRPGRFGNPSPLGRNPLRQRPLKKSPAEPTEVRSSVTLFSTKYSPAVGHGVSAAGASWATANWKPRCVA